MPRPLLNSSVEQLESAFDRNRSDIPFLRELLGELSYRSTQRAQALKSRALAALGVAPKPPVKEGGRPSRPISVPGASPPRLQPPAPGRAIDFARLSTRAAHLLKVRGVDTVEALARLRRTELQRQPNIGAGTLNELARLLAKSGLSFSQEEGAKEQLPEEDIDARQRRLDIIDLSTRAANAVAQRGLTTLGELTALSEAELLSQRAVGRKTFFELRSVLRDHGLDFGQDAAAVDSLPPSQDQQLALSLRCDREPLSARAEGLLRAQGVRFLGELTALNPHELLRHPNVGRTTVAELSSRLEQYGLRFGLNTGGWTPELAVTQSEAAEARAAAERSTRVAPEPFNLAEALLDRLKRAGASDRNREMVARYKGWDGRGGATLEETAQPYGMTRERVRQISKKLLDRVSAQPAPSALKNILEEIGRRVPVGTASLSECLMIEGLLPPVFDLRGVRTAAEAFGLPYSFELALDDRILVREREVAKLDATGKRARKISGRRGCVFISDLPELVEVLGETPDLIRDALQVFGLDRLSEDGWFWWPDQATRGRNRLVNNIEQATAAAGSLEVSELRSAVRRHHRMQGFAPPREVLLEICRGLPWLKIDGRRITWGLSPQAARAALNPLRRNSWTYCESMDRS